MLLRRLLAPVLAVGLLAIAVDANAGSLVMRDEAQIFTPGDTEQLRAIVAKAPFDARVVTTTSYADQAGFSRFVGTLVSEPDMVVVGIDPQHHHVQVHFGTASHIPEADWPAIERAGNDAFKRSAWEEGGADIFRAATTAVSSTGRSTTPVTSPAAASGGSFLVVGLIIMLVVGVILAVILFAVFRRRSPGYGAVPYGGGAPYGSGPYPGGGGPYYGPGGTRGAMGPLGGGLIGAGLGGIAGYELGKMEGEREQRGFDQGSGFDAGGGGSSTPDNGSFDAGGGGSSWDGSSGGGGGDSGGGGGGDSGGGGSDF